MITYLLIGFLFLSSFCVISYFLTLNLLNKRTANKNIDIRNTFTFEVAPKLKSDGQYINTLLLLALLPVLVGFILFTVKYFDILRVVTSILMLLLLFCIGALPFVSISKLKEHLYLNLGSIVLFASSSAFLLYISYYLCKLYDYKNVSLIIAMVISGIIFLTSLVFVFNPRLFDLSNKDEEGNRKPVIHLALSEWVILFTVPLYLIPLILMSTVII